jgi:hypothetical protein
MQGRLEEQSNHTDQIKQSFSPSHAHLIEHLLCTRPKQERKRTSLHGEENPRAGTGDRCQRRTWAVPWSPPTSAAQTDLTGLGVARGCEQSDSCQLLAWRTQENESAAEHEPQNPLWDESTTREVCARQNRHKVNSGQETSSREQRNEAGKQKFRGLCGSQNRI